MARRRADNVPTTELLREAALAYLARRPASVAQLRTVLTRRVDAWARAAAQDGQDPADIEALATRAREAAATLLERFSANGLLDDAAFATHRAARLSRAGRSRRAIAADLAHKGVAQETARAALPTDATAELTSAVTLTRKRRLGPFARDPETAEGHDAFRRALGVLARAGFSHDVASRALKMDREAAEELLRGGGHVTGW